MQSSLPASIDKQPVDDQATRQVDSDDSMRAKKKRHVPFWSENPNVLLQSKHIMEFFPVAEMSYAQRLNAITRTVLVMTIIAFLYSQSLRTLIIGGITIGAIYMLYYYHEREQEIRKGKKADNIEGFNNSTVVGDLFRNKGADIDNTDVFEEPSASNPFGNVLVTDYDYNPDKKPAPPASNNVVGKDILSKAKQLVSDANPDHPGIADKLFDDMGSELMFEQSLRPFASNPSTTIPNDQAGFAEFCYGSMISCKEGNQFACARNLARHTN